MNTILFIALLFILRYENDNLNRYISPIGVLLFNERIVLIFEQNLGKSNNIIGVTGNSD